jgi:PAS domain-containing protein
MTKKRARDDLEERVAGRSAELAGAQERLQGVLDAATYHSRRTDPPHWYQIAGVKLGDGLALSYSVITERKKGEDKLQTLAHRLGLATRVLQAGVWDCDVRTGTILWDAKMYEIYGLPQSLPTSYQIWANAVVPEDLAEAETVMENIISSKVPGSGEFRITLPNGSVRYIQSAAGVVTDET